MNLLNLCEVGGHKQGLPARHIDPAIVVDDALTKDEYGSHAVQAYMSIWHKAGHSHPGGTSLTQKDVLVESLGSSMIPTGKSVSTPTKKRIVQEALDILEIKQQLRSSANCRDPLW